MKFKHWLKGTKKELQGTLEANIFIVEPQPFKSTNVNIYINIDKTFIEATDEQTNNTIILGFANDIAPNIKYDIGTGNQQVRAFYHHFPDGENGYYDALSGEFLANSIDLKKINIDCVFNFSGRAVGNTTTPPVEVTEGVAQFASSRPK
jgi:hypothetical protein